MLFVVLVEGPGNVAPCAWPLLSRNPGYGGVVEALQKLKEKGTCSSLNIQNVSDMHVEVHDFFWIWQPTWEELPQFLSTFVQFQLMHRIPWWSATNNVLSSVDPPTMGNCLFRLCLANSSPCMIEWRMWSTCRSIATRYLWSRKQIPKNDLQVRSGIYMAINALPLTFGRCVLWKSNNKTLRIWDLFQLKLSASQPQVTTHRAHKTLKSHIRTTYRLDQLDTI